MLKVFRTVKFTFPDKYIIFYLKVLYFTQIYVNICDKTVVKSISVNINNILAYHLVIYNILCDIVHKVR